MYVQNHVGCNISDGGIFVGVQVVEELGKPFFRIFCRFCLLCSDAAKCNKGCEVDCSRVIQDGSDDLLYAFDAIWWEDRFWVVI
jgi:hypothetical protein